MLQSWRNFFFIAAEPGGSVTVDKPPLGLWIEASFAFFFGVSGFVTSLPNIISGIFSVPLLYHLVKKYFGSRAGLLAALVMVATPVVVAADRNNTADGMLTFALLLAAWAFIKAAGTGRVRFLLIGAALVGVGFNIKMLQAFLPLPAFYALYFFGAREGWGRKAVNLAAATAILVVVSLSWAVLVDLVPAESRPYIGSSTNNTVMELITGHNGISRIFGGQRMQQNAGARPQLPAGQGAAALPPGQPPEGPSSDGPQSGQPAGGAFSSEIGAPGVVRFFQPPLAKEMSWLLPIALLGAIFAVIAAPIRFPLQDEYQKGAVLWGGWLFTCIVFFSFAGLFHAYYMVMLAPPLGAAVGAAYAAVRRRASSSLASWFLFTSSVGTLGFQIWLAVQFGVQSWWLALPVFVLMAGAVLLLPGSRERRTAGVNAVFQALLFIPLVWTFQTSLSDSISSGLPAAYAGQSEFTSGPPPGGSQPDRRDTRMLAFLQANTQDVEYLVAVPSAQMGAPFVIETGRPVLYMGGFSGGDPVVDSTDLAEMVASGELRYVLTGGQRGSINLEIQRWLQASCMPVEAFSQPRQQNTPGYPPDAGQTLFLCTP